MDSPKFPKRLIEEWLPVQALGVESQRERTPMTPFPAPNRLHVWWARRPLVASRAAVLGALLPATVSHDKVMHILGIHGDPMESRRRIQEARRTGERFAGAAFSYKRAFSYTPTETELSWVQQEQLAPQAPLILDPTAGGGSIPFEAMRLGCHALANDLNAVAWLLLKATLEYPRVHGLNVLRRYKELAREHIRRRDERMAPFFPPESDTNREATNWLWARTIKCPYCGGVIPLSPNWRLNSTTGTGVRLAPIITDSCRTIQFEVVHCVTDQSAGTVSGGDGLCPFPDCARVIDGEQIKAQAQQGAMGEQMYAIVYKETQLVGRTKAGKPKTKTVKGYRAPEANDDVVELVARMLTEKVPEWEARGIIPDEVLPDGEKTPEPLRYGMTRWRDMFSSRQLLGHCFSVEVFQELVRECTDDKGKVSELDKAALVYLTLAMDKMLNYNSRMSVWMPTRELVANTFNRHDFAFCWSHAEMTPCARDSGADWTIEQTGEAVEELIELTVGTGLFSTHQKETETTSIADRLTLTCGSGDQLPNVAGHTVDAIVVDPPYYDNVMYAELSDFFYVWLKRTAGLLYPEHFQSYLTDKDREAVAKAARFKDFSKVGGSGGAKKRAHRDYRERMQAIFAECIRVLKPDGVMVLMFTHKATGAWDALSTGLLQAGFTVTASWPVNTEAEGSMHIKEKNAAKSTIFLVCRPRPAAVQGQLNYWEDVEPLVAAKVTEKVQSFQEFGIRGVDLYLSCFGPALEVFFDKWPLQRGRPQQRPEVAKGATLRLIEDEDWDPYAVHPEDALMAARRAVKEWRLGQITQVKRRAQLDPVTEFFVLAWDAYESPQFPADEALKLGRVVGVSFDEKLRNHVLHLDGDEVVLWDSSQRAKKGHLGDIGSPCMLDTLHKVAHVIREQNPGVARDLLERAGLLDDETFKMALEALLNVLPPPDMAEGSGPVAGAAADCAALEKLRQLVYAAEIPPARTGEQLVLFKQGGGQ